VEEGSSNERFYVVMQGTVEILQADKGIRVLKDGDVFGIENYYLQLPYTTTAIARTMARIASYHISMIHEIIYDHPQLSHQILTSVVRQLEQTTKLAGKHMPEVKKIDLKELILEGNENELEEIFAAISEACAEEAGPQLEKPPELKVEFKDFHDEVLSYFIEESTELIQNVQGIGNMLKLVGIPNEREFEQLQEFVQKLHRLIGGTSSMGFDAFSRLSHKTSLLSAECAKCQDMTIRTLISNMNLVVSVLEKCFASVESIKSVENAIPALEQHLDMCLMSIGIDNPDIKDQLQIDQIFTDLKSR
jgi:hypothetical protein